MGDPFKPDSATPLWLSMGFYLLVVLAIWSPWFTPPSTVGPDGIVRGEQVVGALLIVLIVLIYFSGNLKFQMTAPALACVGIILIIAISTPYGVVARGYPFRIGDFYNFITWGLFAGLLGILTLGVSKKVAINGIIILLISTLLASIFSILQVIEFSSINETIRPLYTDRAAHRGTGTARNPNIFAQILVPPLMILFAIHYVLLDYKAFNSATHKILKIINIFCFGIVFIAMFYTFSRATTVAALVGIFCMTTTIFVLRLGTSPQRRRFGLQLYLVTIIAVFVMIYVNIDLGRFEELTSVSALQDSNLFETRIPRWTAALPLIMEGFVIGHGTSSAGLIPFHKQYGLIDGGFLQFWYHYGVLGVIMMLVILISSLGFSLSILDTDFLRNEPILWASALGLFGTGIAAITMWPIRRLVLHGARHFFLVFLLVFSVVIIANNQKK